MRNSKILGSSLLTSKPLLQKCTLAVKPSAQPSHTSMLSTNLSIAIRHLMWLVAVLSVPISAQAANQTTSQSTMHDSSQDTSKNTLQMPETTVPTIVVIGEKQSRSLMDTASSVLVYDEQSVDALPETPNLSTLMQHSANIVDTGNGNEVPSIRGIDGAGPASGAMAFLAGTQPRVNASIDGRSLDYHELAFAPQSMWDMQQVEVFRGPQSYIQGRNAIAGAVVMKTADPSFLWGSKVKLAAGTHDHRQYAGMLTGPLSKDIAFRISADRFERTSSADIEPYEPVGDPKKIHNTTIRGKLLYAPVAIPQLSSQLTLSQVDTKAPQREAHQPDNPSPRSDARRPVFSNNTKSAIWDINWYDDNLWQFDNILTYTDFDIERLTAPKLPHAHIQASEWSLEPRMQSKQVFGIQDLSAMAGIRFARKTQDESINLFGGAHFDDSKQTQAIYTELTYPLTNRMDMTVGLRAEKESHQRYGETLMITIDLDKDYKAILPKVNFLWRANKNSVYGFQVIRGFNPGGAGVTFSRPFSSYQYEPEYVTNYELYSRQRLMGDRLLITGNVFYNDYQDMQLPYTIPNSQAIVIKNADQVVTYGAELNANWQVSDRLVATGNMGYLNTKIKQYPNSGLENNQLLRAPKLTAGAGIRYKFGNADIASSLNYNSGYYSDLENKAINKTDAIWSMNAELGYQYKQARFALFVTNVFDNDKPIIKYDNGLLGPVYQQPATVGATVSYEF